MCKVFDTSIAIIKSSLSQGDELLNMGSDDDRLDNNSYIIKASFAKSLNIDDYIIKGIRKIRDKGANVNKETIIKLVNDYKEENVSCRINITEYFIKEFKKRNNVVYRYIAGESKSAMIDEIQAFFKNMSM